MPTSAADSAPVTPNGISTLLDNCWFTLFINGKSTLTYGQIILPIYRIALY